MSIKKLHASMKQAMAADPTDLVIYGPRGEVWSLAELNAWWGSEIVIEDPSNNPEIPYLIRPVEFRIVDGPCSQMVRVLDGAGNPYNNAAVARWWADAPRLPDFPGDCHATRARDNAVYGFTNENGDIGFGMGGGDMPPSSGVWVIHCDYPAVYVGGLGWIPKPTHTTIRITFKVVPRDTAPPTPPPGAGDIRDDLVVIHGALGTIQEAVDDIISHLDD